MTKQSTQIEAVAIEAAQARLKDYLRGYGRGQASRLGLMASRRGWELEAGRVLRARWLSLLTALDDELLSLIERGQVDVPTLALAVAKEFRACAGGRDV
ncbi:hypothetical protein [Rhodoferax sp.]|uniref:hypothetical protein n=1 Tax=Rhodoferax sp. TaxID=50421 RepID=UPI002775A07B|nr:hypothetical protein [Rhodoferax sp.]